MKFFLLFLQIYSSFFYLNLLYHSLLRFSFFFCWYFGFCVINNGLQKCSYNLSLYRYSDSNRFMLHKFFLWYLLLYSKKFERKAIRIEYENENFTRLAWHSFGIILDEFLNGYKNKYWPIFYIFNLFILRIILTLNNWEKKMFSIYTCISFY